MLKFINDDCLSVLVTMRDCSIDMVLTSPPYDDLRAYNGYSFNFEEIAKELYRVLKDGGVMVWVVNDAVKNGSESGTSFKQALYFKDIGFNLHDTMIFAKNNPIPQNHNRYEQCFEYMFVLSKGKPKTFNPIRVPTKNAGAEFEWGNRKTILDDKQCRRHRNSDVRKVNDTKIHNNIFYYSIGGSKTGHPAVFPLQLAVDHIVTWSNKGDIVLDPFMGSGTTGLACVQNNRHFIGIEISDKYVQIAKERCEINDQL